MKLKISAAVVTLALLSACGGSDDDEPTGRIAGIAEISEDSVEVAQENPIAGDRVIDIPSTTIQDDRDRPSVREISTTASVVRSNGVDLSPDSGPQRVDLGRTNSWPGLRYGDFFVSNNPWNASAAGYPAWYQDISLYQTDNGYGVKYDWDWGASPDTNGSIFDTKSYPEVIYGTKSAGERSGTFDETGLPVEIFDAPTFTIDYAFRHEGRRSDSPTSGGTDSEFNIAIESFYHETCDVQRNGNSEDNTVFETMVWLKLDERTPSGEAPRGVFTTSDGRSYDVYTKARSNPHYIAFVARDTSLSGTVMYTELLNHAQDNASEYGIFQLQSTHCLANILMGTEIWHGAGSFYLDEYTIHRSY